MASVPALQTEVKGNDTECTCNIVILLAGCAQCVAECIAVITTESDAQAFYRVVVYAESTSIVVGNFEFIRTRSTIVCEILCSETL